MRTQRRMTRGGLGWALGALFVTGCAQQKELVLPQSDLIDTGALCRQLEAKLPRGWRIVSVIETDTPKGWTRLAGARGLRVYMKDPNTRVFHPVLQPYHPFFVIWLMPRAWDGSEPTRDQHIRGGAYQQGTYTPDPDPDPNRIPAAYWGSNAQHHYFHTTAGLGLWRKAPVIAAKILAVTRWRAPASQPAEAPSAETKPGANKAPRTALPAEPKP